MQDTMTPSAAGAWLQSTQQLRTHWSGVITTHIGYAVLLNVAIWSYFLKVYIDSLITSSKGESLYILLATALSAIVLGAWRLYTHRIDNNIAGLYPDFIFCEGVLRVPPDYGTSAYLIRAVPNVHKILRNKNLTPQQKTKGILDLVKLRRIGRRGHLRVDISALVFVSVMGLVSTVLQSQSKLSGLATGCFILISIGLFSIIWAIFAYQKNPSEKDIENILPKPKK